MSAEPVRVGIIGAGMMGRETALAISRWGALIDHPARPVVVAVCDINPDALTWFDGLGTVEGRFTDHRRMLERQDLDVVYAAVRHDHHEAVYTDVIESGADLFGEKPFGIDSDAAHTIAAVSARNPDVFIRCASEFPFYPGAQRALREVASGRLGRIIEAQFGFSHSSDLDPDKQINWKRQSAYCGAAGVMNDLGMHVVHIPLRLGWVPTTVFATLQNLITVRPGPDGQPLPCDTWDNAVITGRCEIDDTIVPLTLSTKRIDPGQLNSWSLRISGLTGAVEFSTRNPKAVRILRVDGGDQSWREVEVGSQSIYPTVTGAIFESGFSDAILQMWACYLAERCGQLGDRFGCVTLEEVLLSHRLWDAAMRSHDTQTAVLL